MFISDTEYIVAGRIKIIFEIVKSNQVRITTRPDNLGAISSLPKDAILWSAFCWRVHYLLTTTDFLFLIQDTYVSSIYH